MHSALLSNADPTTMVKIQSSATIYSVDMDPDINVQSGFSYSVLHVFWTSLGLMVKYSNDTDTSEDLHVIAVFRNCWHSCHFATSLGCCGCKTSNNCFSLISSQIP